VNTPFAPLTQNYQECRYDTFTVVVNQAGSTVGTVSILAPFLFAFVVVVMYFVHLCGVADIKKTYTNSEKADALDDLALKLLLIRDHGQGVELESQHSVLAQIVEELTGSHHQVDTIYKASLVDKRLQVNWHGVRSKLALTTLSRKKVNPARVVVAAMKDLEAGRSLKEEQGQEPGQEAEAAVQYEEV
jgi:hypothetical protein